MIVSSQEPPAGDGGVVPVSWRWEWVPGPQEEMGVKTAWGEHVTSLFDGWLDDGFAAARKEWSSETDLDYPIDERLVGEGAARWLRERADELPAHSRLAWGAAFPGEVLRWAPVPVVVEFREPASTDSAYLADDVGAAGFPGDAREPMIDYVATEAGDGIRVFALLRGENGEAGGRLDAALRLEVPGSDGSTTSADVLFTARVFELGLLGAIGPGVEHLMHLVAAEFLPRPDEEQPALVIGAS